MRVERTLVGIMFILGMTAGGCGGRLAYNLPPSSRLMEPGPGVGGPGPGVIPPAGSPYGIYGGAVGRYGDGMGSSYMGGPDGGAPCAPYAACDPGAPAGSPVMQASYQCGGEGGCPCHEGAAPCSCCNPYVFGRPDSTEAYACDGMMAGAATSQIAFLGDEGVQVSWDVAGYGLFDSVPVVIPGRQDFYQGAIYRLRLTNLPGRPGVELFPTLEVGPVTPRTDAYLAHSPIPVQFTEEDFDQVLSGNFVTKVIYLPDPEFQELALAGVETLVSTRLDPGVDPIAEADRRGSILAILRMGNKDFRRGGAPPEQFELEEGRAASHEAAANGDSRASYARQALYNEHLDELGNPAARGGIVPAQYCGPYGDGAMAGAPMGMPTSGFAPTAMPPNMIAGAPQWGMPITGTPIGLPGPPHVPLGVPAGLQKHVMKNRTRVLLPPPVAKVQLSVKQRPGLNYPQPVNHVHVNEVQREPFGLPNWMTNMFSRHHQAGMYGGNPAAYCPPQ